MFKGGQMKVKLNSKDERSCSGKGRVCKKKQRLSNFNGVYSVEPLLFLLIM